MTLVSGYIRCADIRGGSVGNGRQTRVGWSTAAIFTLFASHFFSETLEMRPALLYRYAVRRQLFSDPKMHDLK